MQKIFEKYKLQLSKASIPQSSSSFSWTYPRNGSIADQLCATVVQCTPQRNLYIWKNLKMTLSWFSIYNLAKCLVSKDFSVKKNTLLIWILEKRSYEPVGALYSLFTWADKRQFRELGKTLFQPLIQENPNHWNDDEMRSTQSKMLTLIPDFNWKTVPHNVGAFIKLVMQT